MKVSRFLGSVKLTVAILFGVIILVFWGTLEQVQTGIYFVQKHFFRTFFIYFRGFPVFFGGYFFALLFLVNLFFVFVATFRLKKNKIGILFIHAGLALLVVNELVTAFFAKESQIPLKVGENLNFSESLREMELAVIDKSPKDYDTIVSIPVKKLKSNQEISHLSLPFPIRIKETLDHARLFQTENSEALFATKGIGTKVMAVPALPTVKDDQLDTKVVFAEIGGDTWLFSNAFPMPQTVDIEGKNYDIVLRRKRYYFPFSLKLTKFVHEKHPGTEIPKDFTSYVEIYDQNGEFDRNAVVYMNHPLRFDNKTFYQASFGENDTLSVFQVVENPGVYLPYISSLLVGFGLFVQFTTSFMQFRKKRS